jgi:hypothetical protein
MHNESESSMSGYPATWRFKLSSLCSAGSLLWLVLFFQLVASVSAWRVFSATGKQQRKIDEQISEISKQLKTIKETGNAREHQLNDVVKSNELLPSTLPTSQTKVIP